MVYARFGDLGTSEWTVAGTLYSDTGPLDSKNQQYSIDVSGLSGICLVKVHARADGSPDGYAEMMVDIGFDPNQAYIKIE